MTVVPRLVDRLLGFVTREHGLIGLSLWRVSTGACLIYWYLAHYANRHYLWGPDGVYPFDEFVRANPLSLYALSASPAYFDVAFHLGIIIAGLFTLGWRPRMTAFLSLVFQFSLYRRNRLFPNGGDNLTVIVQFLLLFSNTAACFAVDAPVRQRLTVFWRDSLRRRVVAAVHNAAWLAAVLQLCTVYMFAGLHKASGQMWSSGTALYYILSVSEYSYPPYTEWFIRNTYLVVFFTYATIVFQIGFSFVLFQRATRLLWILAGLAFHASIAAAMGLWTFSWFVVSVYALLITDAEYRAAAAGVRRWLDRFRLQVFYDGRCRACVTTARVWKGLDFAGMLDFRSFRDAAVSNELGLASEVLAARMHVRELMNGRIHAGFPAIVRVAQRLVFLWPLLPPFGVMQMLGLGPPAYDWFAARRFRFGLVQSCRGNGCEGPLL